MVELESITDQMSGDLARPSSPPLDNGSELGIATIRILIQLVGRRRQLLMSTVICGAVGLVYSLILTPIFTATSRIMTPQQTQSTAALLMSQLANTTASSLAVAAGGSALGLKSPSDLYVGLLNSRPVADAIIQQFGLQAVYKSIDPTEARRVLASNTRIATEKSGMISITVSDKDKRRAADIANAYTDQLRLLTKTLAVTEASQRRLFYEEQLKRAKDDLVTAEIAFQQVQQKKGLIELDAQAKAAIEALSTLRAQVAAKQVEVQALRSYSTDRNPRLQIAENQLNSLHAEALRLEEHSGSPGSADLGLKDMAAAGMDYFRAQHELQYRQVLFDLLLKQYDAAKLDEAKDAAVIQVVESAIPPDRKAAPRRSIIVLIFLMIGFLVGVSQLFLTNYIGSRPRISRALRELAATARSK